MNNTKIIHSCSMVSALGDPSRLTPSVALRWKRERRLAAMLIQWSAWSQNSTQMTQTKRQMSRSESAYATWLQHWHSIACLSSGLHFHYSSGLPSCFQLFPGGLEVLLRSSCTNPGHRTDRGRCKLKPLGSHDFPRTVQRTVPKCISLALSWKGPTIPVPFLCWRFRGPALLMVFGDPITMLFGCQERNAPIHDKKIGIVFCGRQAGAALPLAITGVSYLRKVRQEMRVIVSILIQNTAVAAV